MDIPLSSGARLLQKTSKLRDLPTLSVVLEQSVRVLRDTRSSRAQLADLLRRDQVLAAKILRLVNSSFYGREAPVTDLRKAVHFLGDDTLSLLVIGTQVFGPEELAASSWFDVREFWHHSVSSAFAAELIALRSQKANPQDCFTCGLLHNIGRLAFFHAERELFRTIVLEALETNQPLLKVEQAHNLPGHHVLGERLAEEWHLPVGVRKAIRFWARDVADLKSLYPEMQPVLRVTQLADTLVRRLEIGFSGDPLNPDYSGAYVDSLGLNARVMVEIEEELLRVLDPIRDLVARGSNAA